ncbi:hypothetical protein Bpla01_18390 [Burkholderia plantarii]|nr:hypothetical protein Bpla01_18390 [Burkholderia plantarii]
MPDESRPARGKPRATAPAGRAGARARARARARSDQLVRYEAPPSTPSAAVIRSSLDRRSDTVIATVLA